MRKEEVDLSEVSSAGKDSGEGSVTDIIEDSLIEIKEIQMNDQSADCILDIEGTQLRRKTQSLQNKDGKGRWKTVYSKYKKWLPTISVVLFTSYFVVSLSLRLKANTSDILALSFIYAFVIIKYGLSIFPRARISIVMACRRLHRVLSLTKSPALSRYVACALVAISAAVVFSISLSLPAHENDTKWARMQSLLGSAVITLIMVLTSRNPKKINWHTVYVGYMLQYTLGCIVMKTRWGSNLFAWLANAASGFLSFSRFGAELFFGSSAKDAIAMSIFPSIIFFAAFVQVMYYLGAVQWLLGHLGWFLHRTLDITCSEAIVAAASPFIGQSENVLLVKSYLDTMTESELHACMTAGFATISGSVFQAYVALGVNSKDLVTACIMSIPCSLALSKIRYPETTENADRSSLTEKQDKRPMKIGDEHSSLQEANILHALGNGAATGMSLSLLILATVIAMVSLISAIDFMFSWFGEFVGITGLSLELILGYLLYPVAWLLGVPSKDSLDVAKLLGLKIISNEFVAYSRLTNTPILETNSSEMLHSVSVKQRLSLRALTIAQFSLAGFANFGSVAQQIASLGSLAPSRKADISRIAPSAMITGAVSTMLTSAIVSSII